jgi:DNA-directed RNA polymerase specialized sigma24 family protein
VDFHDETDVNRIRGLIAAMKAGDDKAVAGLMEHYFERLVRLARSALNGTSRGAADEFDIAQSVFKSFVLRARRRGFPKLEGPEELWQILCRIVRCKAARLRKREARSEAARRTLATTVGPAQLVPADLATWKDWQDFLLRSLRDESERQVARWKLDRYTDEEIAAMLGITVRSVERKMALIRKRCRRLERERERIGRRTGKTIGRWSAAGEIWPKCERTYPTARRGIRKSCGRGLQVSEPWRVPPPTCGRRRTQLVRNGGDPKRILGLAVEEGAFSSLRRAACGRQARAWHALSYGISIRNASRGTG